MPTTTVAECYERAQRARQRANEASPLLRPLYNKIAAGWLQLAKKLIAANPQGAGLRSERNNGRTLHSEQ